MDKNSSYSTSERGNLLSIIIPLYYGNKYVTDVIGMIKRNFDYLAQFEKLECEIILVNDSPNESVQVPREFEFDIKLISNKENYGIHKSRVIGLEYARGNYIVFLDQDDIAKDYWLLFLWRAITNQQSNVAVSNSWVNRFSLKLSEDDFVARVNDANSYFLYGNPIVTPGQVMIKRDIIPEEWKKCSLNHNGSDDLLLWLLLLKKGVRFNITSEPLFYHNPIRSEHSVNYDEIMLSAWEVMCFLSKTNMISSEELSIVKRRISRKEEYIERISTISRWQENESKGKDFITELKKENVKQVAIYGMGDVGVRAFEKLEKSGIEISYYIDKRGKDYFGELKCFSEARNLPYTDMIIDTTRGLSQEIEEQIKNQGLKLKALRTMI